MSAGQPGLAFEAAAVAEDRCPLCWGQDCPCGDEAPRWYLMNHPYGELADARRRAGVPETGRPVLPRGDQ